MKKISLALIILLLFLACSALGYQLASRVWPTPTAVSTAVPSTVDPGGFGGEQHNIMLIHVDQLDQPQPKLQSVWYVSVFFMDGSRPNVSFGQIYPGQTDSTVLHSIGKSFSVSAQGEPESDFWQAMQAVKIQWEGYILIDDYSMQRFMEWANGPGDFANVLSSIIQYPAESNQIIGQTCQNVFENPDRQPAPFDWNGLLPAHFRSSIRMELALSYWNRMTSSQLPVQCEVLPPIYK